VIDLYYWPTPNGHKITSFVPWGMQWEDVRHAEPKLPAQGIEIAFLSTDRPEILYSSLKAAGIHYTLHFDALVGGVNASHVAYHLDDSTIAKQKQYGVDLEATTGTTQHALRVPSVFIIDTTDTMRYVYSNPDYQVRLVSDVLLAAALPYVPRNAKTHQIQ
jgi:peroxiredoxin